MDEQGQDRQERLFRAALLLPPEEWEDFLAAACSEDQELCDELLSLLRADQHADRDDFLNTPVDVLLGTRGDDTRGPERTDPWIGQHIGAFTVIRRIGRGGMGAVYLGRRDRPFKQYVALKIIRSGADSHDVLLRFEMERQILASLNHPHIARLIDGGVTDDGLPYFAMEYVEGVPITRYCDERQLSVDARLRLFQTVCAAVQYAHQNLVIHRDIKPSNILVTREGTVKLLDFGIAKLLNPALSPVDLPMTRTEHRLMTPEYASPEQVRGEPLTTASDVYALGVILYELLTGHRPYRLTRASSLEILQVVCEQDPERPSTRVIRTETVRRQDGTTEEITPEVVSRVRGATVDRLRRRLRGDLDNIVMMALRKEVSRRFGSAAELRQDIEHYLAGEPVLAHRDTRWYRLQKFVRRHRGESIAGALGLFFLVAGLVAALTQADRARWERDRAARALDQSEEVTRFLEHLFEANDPSNARGRDVPASVLLERGLERMEALDTRPIVRARMLGVIGRVYASLGRYDRAQPLLEEALAMRRAAQGGEDPAVASALTDLATVQAERGFYREAEPNLRMALAIEQQRPGTADLEKARTMDRLGTLLHQKGEYASAETMLREALTLRARVLGDHHPDTITSLTNVALLLLQVGRYQEAESLLRECLARRRSALGEEHLDVARSMEHLAQALRTLGSLDESERLLRQSLAMRRRILGDEHPEVAAGLFSLGQALRSANKNDSALALFQEALAMQRRMLGTQHPAVAQTLREIGFELVYHVGDTTAGEQRFREALALLRRSVGERHPDIVIILRYLSLIEEYRGREEASESLLQEALAMARSLFGEQHLYVSVLLADMGMQRFRRGDLAGAEPYYRESLEVRRALVGPTGLGMPMALGALAWTLERLGRREEAEPLLREAVDAARNGTPDDPNHTALIWRLAVLGRFLTQGGAFEEAEPILQEARIILDESGSGLSMRRQVYEQLVELYEAWGRTAEAAVYRATLAEITADGQ